MEEVRTTLSQMHPTKALGLDSMNPLFFPNYWHIVGTNVSNVVLDCIDSGKIL